eukprot:SAG22_NODE_178_length_16142_cov_13.187995_6_plen_71_part_00
MLWRNGTHIIGEHSFLILPSILCPASSCRRCAIGEIPDSHKLDGWLAAAFAIRLHALVRGGQAKLGDGRL